MNPQELKVAIRAILETNDAFTSNHIPDEIRAIDLLIDNFGEGSGGEGGIDTVLAIGQQLVANREIVLNGNTLRIVLVDGSILIDDQTNKIEFTSGVANFRVDNGFILANYPEFADNAAALAGGVPNGGTYFTTEGTERIVKMAHD